jgi:hypothetical protein
MNSHNQKLWVIGTMASLSLVGGLSAQALDYGFDLVFSTGPLSGQSFPGSITVDPSLGTDDSTAPGAKRFDPNTGFLSFDATVDGFSFALADDNDFPFFPITVVTMIDGTILDLNYLSSNRPDGAELILFPLNVGNISVTFSRANSEESTGSLRQNVTPPPVSVPDAHASAVLFLTCLAGLGWWSRRA